MRTVHLVDASPYIFRAYFSIPSSLRAPDGRPINAVRGFTSFLFELLERESVTHVAVAYDESLTTSFRNELYPAYKAQRELPPAELEAQLRDCRQIATALGLATFASDRYEADDLIAALCKPLDQAGHAVTVVSPDKDLSQLVSDRVSVLDWARDTRSGIAEVRERFGVGPDLIPDWLALGGDSVDNIPGVKGVGPKAAAVLLSALGPIESLFDRLDEVPSLPMRGAASVRARLEGCREQALLSKRLATVAFDALPPMNIDDLAWRGADRRLLEDFSRSTGLSRLDARIQRWRD
jgi:5'-3' exonuclease